MSIDTPLHPNTIIIDDANPGRAKVPSGQSTGYKGMWADGCAKPKEFGDLGIPLIPESEWIDRIREQEAKKSTLRHFAAAAGMPCLNQASTNYCWINAPTYCAQLIRLKQSGQVRRYSPASAGARIKGFRNVGGWGSQGLEFMREHGVNETSAWPANAISRQYDTAENRQAAKLNVVREYFKLESWAEQVSCVLALIPVAVGYNWWRHEVTHDHLPILDGTVEGGIRNSWGMGWGDQGWGVLRGRKKLADDAVAIVSMLAA